MGNRGCLHDEARRIVRPLASGCRAWVTCVLSFKRRRRRVMTPGRYTELFFLDEATALAAGHRPCAECRRNRLAAFRTAWAAHLGLDGSLPTAGEIDDGLHAERIAPDRSKRTFPANLDGLPDGVFVRHPGSRDSAWLVWGDGLLAWSAGGYTKRVARPTGVVLPVLTPASTVGAIRAGYVPDVHPSAAARPDRRR